MNRHTPADGREIDKPTDLKFVGPATASVIEEAGFSAQAIVEKTVSFKMLVEAGVNPGVAAKIRRWHSLSWTFDSGDDLDRRSQQVRGLEDDEREWVAASYGDRDDDSSTSEPEETTEDEFAAEAEWAGRATEEPAPDASETTADDFAAEAEWVAAAGADSEADESETTGEADTADAADTTTDSELDAESAWVQETTDAAETDGSGDPVAAESAWRERSVSPPVTEIEGVDESDAEKLRAAGVTSVRSLATCSPELVADLTGLDRDRVETWRDRARERSE